MGARAYRYLSLYDPSPGCLIEIGSERGEGSTAWLAEYADRKGLKFYTADIDPLVYRRAAEITQGARNESGTKLLGRLRSPISVAYMDGFDWIPQGLDDEGWIQDQRRRYQHLGRALTNTACQAEHLLEAERIVEKANDRCAVICDDTWLNGEWNGKGGRAVPFFLEHGFQVVDHDLPEGNSLGFVVLARD